MKKLAVVILGSIICIGSFAEDIASFQASLTPDVAIQDRDTRIKGVSLNVWGENPQSALTIGFVNGSTGDSYGFTFMPWTGAFFNYAENYKGVHWGWVNITSGEFVGWQSGLYNYADTFTGAQTGFVNYAGTMKGFQWGLVNASKQMSGLQLGAVNYAHTTVNGLQIGLVNIIPQNEWFSNFPSELAKGMVIVNWRFE